MGNRENLDHIFRLDATRLDPHNMRRVLCISLRYTRNGFLTVRELRLALYLMILEGITLGSWNTFVHAGKFES
jgi:hypothetical protein